MDTRGTVYEVFGLYNRLKEIMYTALILAGWSTFFSPHELLLINNLNYDFRDVLIPL